MTTPFDEIGRRKGSRGMATSNGTAKPEAPLPKRPCLPPPYQPFPVEALPEPLRSFVAEGAVALGCDPAFIAMPALAIIAGAVGATRVLQLKRGWKEPSVLWTTVVAESGTLKSPALQLVVGPVYRKHQKLIRQYKADLAKYTEDLQKWKEAKARHKKCEGDDPGEAPEPPVLRRIVTSDTTIERLVETLEDNPRGVLLVRDELAAWVGSFTKYKGKQGGSDLPHWLEAHRAGPWLVDRKTPGPDGRRTYFVPRAAISVTGTIQPGTLARVLTPEFLESGWAARLLAAAPKTIRKQWREVEVSPEAERSYEELLDKLYALSMDKDHEGELVPAVVKLSREGKELWVDFYNEFAGEQFEATGDIAAALSKIEACAARLALLHHLVGQLWAGKGDLATLGPESMAAGITLARWFGDEAKRVYQTLDEEPEDRERRRLVELVQRKGGSVAPRDVMRGCRRYATADAAEAALEELVKAGWGTWQPADNSRQGGRPTRVFQLSEAVDSADADKTPPNKAKNGVVSTSTVSAEPDKAKEEEIVEWTG